jgi:hydroxymethylglutaryl-CoA reductase (NADPH)
VRHLNVAARRRFLEKETGANLENIAQSTFDPEKVVNRNCENLIGATQVPLGVAGPLKIRCFGSGTKNCYLPLATTEGALVASVNRGCKATRLAGGITVLGENVGATRAPVFKVKNLKEAQKLVDWTEKHLKELKETAKKTDTFLSLKEFQPMILGRNVYLRFVFNTREAMGMNMVTIASERMVQLIKVKTGSECVSLTGNLCTDKKLSWQNIIKGRGKRIWAEVVLSQGIIKGVLKTSSEKIAEVVYRKCLLGSALAGASGFNGHFANVVAALFLATGQDMAHVVEGSLGMTTAEVVEKNDLYFGVYLPDLMVGTVGGGTNLPAQKEALKILGLGQGKRGEAIQLAEIIGGAVLAGELSLMAALASGQLAQAHARLERGKDD